MDKQLTSSKRRAFIAVTLLLPVVGLLLLEAGLRIAGYGPDLSLCTKTTVRGVDYYAMNGGVRSRYFSGRFFGGKSVAENTAPEFFRMPKPADTYRIFCLGGSTTFGYPYGVLGSFSRFLQDRLQAVFPEKKIEVVNFGITATNSFTVLDMARDAVAYSPDLIIVYDGHNEFYGALGIASRESAGRMRALGLAYMRLTHLKTFLLVSDAVDAVRSLFASASADDLSGTAMERLAKGKTIPYGSPLYAGALDWYRENMDETARICGEAGVPVIFSTQVSNLRDLPPFVSEFSEQAVEQQRETFRRAFAEGMDAMKKNDLPRALASFTAASSADSLRADARYYMAKCLEQTGDTLGALRAYMKARDLDQLRFRQSDDFNNAVRALQGKNVFVCDAEEYLRQESAHGLIGNNLILEHLHPNLHGYFLLAKAYARTMKEHGLGATADIWARRDTVADASLWNRKIISPLDEAIGMRRIAILTSSWPFQPEGPAAAENLSLPAPTDPIGRIARDVVERAVTWERGMVMAADYFESQKMSPEAEACYRSLLVHTPFNASPYIRLAQLLAEHGREDEAVRILHQSTEVEPTHHAYQLLGRIAYTRGRFGEAIGALELAKQHAASIAERTDASLGLALTYFRMGRVQEAEAESHYILTFNPGSVQAKEMLRHLQPSGAR